MFFKIRHTLIMMFGGFLFVLDRFFKNKSLGDWSSNHLINKYLGWQPFQNNGAAFGLPISNTFIILLSLPIIFLLFYLLFIALKKDAGPKFYPLYFIILGAISNFWDRAYYKATLDYFLILTGVINLADIMIVVGLLLLLQSELTKKQVHTTPA